MALLEVNNISKQYISKKFMSAPVSIQALHDVSLSLEKGECLGIVGESGCGKSTLCRMICGIETPDSGTVTLDHEAIFPRRRGSWRSRIQMVFQDSQDAVDPRYTAAQIIAEPLLNYTDVRDEKLQARLEELMRQVGLPAEDLSKKGISFSGGQLQRICIARALALHPDIILLDEPLSSLDVSVQAQILNLLREIKEDTGVSYIIISHDIEAIYYLSDSLMVMYAGEVMETMTDIQDIHKACHPYTRYLLMPFEERGELPPDKLPEPVKKAARTGIRQVTEHGCVFYDRCRRRTSTCKGQDIPERMASTGHMVRCLKN